jgi:hypothetical protein
MAKLDLFKEILPSILKTKNHILEDEKDYEPFVANLALSQYDDAIFYVNEMNLLWNIPRRMQYDYYFYTLRGKSRPFPKWGKVPKHEDLAAVKLYFGYSDSKAKQALKVLTEEQLETIRKETKIE